MARGGTALGQGHIYHLICGEEVQGAFPGRVRRKPARESAETGRRSPVTRKRAHVWPYRARCWPVEGRASTTLRPRLAGQSERGEQRVRERGIVRDDAAAPTAGALQHVVCEHAARQVGPRQPSRT